MLQFGTEDTSEVVEFGLSDASAAIHEQISKLTADSLSSQQSAI